MSKYQMLRNNPPKLTIKKGAKEVIFKTVSCMCDNVRYLRFKKDQNDEFKLDGMGFSISYWQMHHEKFAIEWKADENKWNEVATMINTGTSVIESVVSR